MARLPFDPGRARGANQPEPAAHDEAWSVSQVAAAVSAAIDAGLPTRVSVLGEVSQPRESTHLYFTLKDAAASLQAVMFASTLRRARARPEHGRQVIAHGKLSYYEPSGRLSLIVDRVEPVGQGALEQQLRELADELRAQGWFDPERKRPLPTLPRRVAVITSPTGAALQDVLDTLGQRCRSIEVLTLGVKVQGEGSAAQVAGALRWVSQSAAQRGIDVVVVTRGGGSMEDLWSFNDKGVAQAALECSIPVVAAIGHETDTTLIELVADRRAATPTQAAVHIAPDADALLEQTRRLADRFARSMGRSIAQRRETLDAISRRSVLAEPRALLAPNRQRIDERARSLSRAQRSLSDRRRSALDRLALRLEAHRPAAVQATRREHLRGAVASMARAQRTLIDRRRARLEALGRELEAVGPRAVLQRGYTCTMHEAGGVVRSASSVGPGDRVRTLTADGGFESVVRRPRPAGAATRDRDPGADAKARADRPSPRRASQPPSAQGDGPGLFGDGD